MKATAAQPATILMIGPDPGWVGGMSAVVGQMLGLDLAGRYRFAFLPITVATRARESRIFSVVRHLRQRRRLASAIRRERPAIVHLHTCSGFSFVRSAWDLRVARKRGRRTVLHVHGGAMEEYFGRSSSLERRWIRRTLASADRVVALSGDWRTRLLAIAPTARVTVVENAVEVPPSVPLRTRRASCRFLTLAKMDEIKGIGDLLDACVLLCRRGIAFELTLAGPEGDAGDAAEINRKIAGRGLSACVRYVGSVVGKAKDALFADADVYVQPSRFEGMPIAVLEAMAWALPVIATAVGAMPELVEDGVHGRVVAPRNAEALASAMGALAFDTATRTALGESARMRVSERFGIRRFRDDLLALYDELMRRGVSNAARSDKPMSKAALW